MNHQPGHPGKKPGLAAAAVLWVLVSVTLAAGIIRVEPRGPVTPGTTLAICIDLPGRLRAVELEIARLEPAAKDGTGPAPGTIFMKKTTVTDGDTKTLRDHNPEPKKIQLEMHLPRDFPPGTYIFRAYPGPGALPDSYLVEIAAPNPGIIAGMLASVKEIKEIIDDPYWLVKYFKGETGRDPAYGDLYLMDGRDYQVKARLTFTGDCLEPSWAPAGDKVVYIRWQNSAGQLWELDLANEKPAAPPRRLLKDFAGNIQAPRWSPDGKHLAFLSGQNLWIMNKDGETARQLTHGENTREILAWNRDGDQVIYCAAPGTGYAVLTGRGELLSLAHPDIKPEERAVPVIRRVDIRQGNTQRLLYHESWLWLPYLSPDGTILVFSLPEQTGGYRLWTRQGPGFTRADMRRAGFDPAWSPRGDRIVFVFAGEIQSFPGKRKSP